MLSIDLSNLLTQFSIFCWVIFSVFTLSVVLIMTYSAIVLTFLYLFFPVEEFLGGVILYLGGCGTIIDLYLTITTRLLMLLYGVLVLQSISNGHQINTACKAAAGNSRDIIVDVTNAQYHQDIIALHLDKISQQEAHERS